MPQQLDLYLHLKYRIQDWLMGTDGCSDLANFCGLSLSHFKDNFIMWGLMDVTGRAKETITEQDVWNAIFMLEIRRLALRKR